MIVLSSKKQQALRFLLSAIVLALLVYQLWQLSDRLNTAVFWSAVAAPRNIGVLLLVLLLMPVNWLLESWKWWLLLETFHSWPFVRVVQAVMAGVSISAITPNRIGEIGGRLLKADKSEAAGVVSSSLLGALCQWLVFIGLGVPALCWVSTPFLGAYPAYLIYAGSLLAIILLTLLFIYGGRGLSLLLGVMDRWLPVNIQAAQQALKEISLPLVAQATLVALFRSLVYMIQLYLLLTVFGIDLPFLQGLAGIAAIYLIQAGIPLPPGINLITRAELGVLIWGNEPEVVAASLAAFSSLFAINILLPSLLMHWLIVKKV